MKKPTTTATATTTSARIFISALTCLLLVLQTPTTEALKCYRCTILPPQYVGEADQPCAKFDGSSRFYHECPASTFCMKRIIHYRLPNGSMVTTAERDCASQRYVFQDYNYEERRWHSKETIDKKVYKEGCFTEENRGTPNGPSEYCYCTGNLCNTSPPTANKFQIGSLLIMAVLLLAFGTS